MRYIAHVLRILAIESAYQTVFKGSDIGLEYPSVPLSPAVSHHL